MHSGIVGSELLTAHPRIAQSRAFKKSYNKLAACPAGFADSKPAVFRACKRRAQTLTPVTRQNLLNPAPLPVAGDRPAPCVCAAARAYLLPRRPGAGDLFKFPSAGREPGQT